MKKTKVLIIVPHQDDEINLVGNILRGLVREKDVYVLFTSLDNHPARGKIRKNEALNSLSVYGVDANHIDFFAFPDTPNKAEHHFYSANEELVVKRFEEYILELMPSVIFATDFDFHSDHRMCSLAFETAMGNILKLRKNYHPLVFKGFCYDTAFYGPEDFTACHNKKTEVKNELLSNPSFEWKDRISFCSDEGDSIMMFRPTYKALRKHKSQYAILHAKSIINADNVFWQRRSDNLAFNAKLSAGGNEPERLSDFKVVDTSDIRTLNPHNIDYSKGCWNFSEKSCDIIYTWENLVSIDRVILHGNINCSHREAACITIISNSTIIAKCEFVREYARGTEILFPQIKTDNLQISIIKGNYFSGLSEIEILFGEQKFDEIYDINKQQEHECKIQSGLVNSFDRIIYTMTVIETKIVRKIKNILDCGSASQSTK